MTNLLSTNWSPELKEKLSLLNRRQVHVITCLIMAETQGLSTARMVRHPYSCRHCGRCSANLAAWQRHSTHCKSPEQEWRFVTSSTQFCRDLASPTFRECLELARLETALAALDEARQMLQLHAPKAVQELSRQIDEGERDTDRRAAAIAILDRAGLDTAPKATTQLQSEQLSFWLAELRAGEAEAEQLDELDPPDPLLLAGPDPA